MIKYICAIIYFCFYTKLLKKSKTLCVCQHRFIIINYFILFYFWWRFEKWNEQGHSAQRLSTLCRTLFYIIGHTLLHYMWMIHSSLSLKLTMYSKIGEPIKLIWDASQSQPQRLLSDGKKWISIEWKKKKLSCNLQKALFLSIKRKRKCYNLIGFRH